MHDGHSNSLYQMEVTDEELLLCALPEEDPMNSDEDEELCAAVEKVGRLDSAWFKQLPPKVVRQDIPAPIVKKWWQLPPKPVCDLMRNRPKMAELYDLIDDCSLRPIHKWPDKVTDYFYGREPLNNKGRYIIMTFFWYNGMNPELAVEWFKFMGAFCPPKEKREEEMRSVICALNEKMKSSSGRACLQRWSAFDLKKFRWVPCWYPSDKMLRGLRL